MMMTTAPMNEQQARAVAFIVNAIRPDWDPAGIVAALGRARAMGGVAEVTIAAIRAATNPAAQTPAVIHMQGPHWSTTGPTTSPPPPTVDACPVHDHIRPAHNCRCCRSEYLATGAWPAGTRHTQAPTSEETPA